MSVARSIASPEPSPPPWRAIGTEPGSGTEVLYVFEVDGEVRKMRQAVLGCLGGVMSLDPDANRWRMMFPHPTSRGRFDLAGIIGFLMAECRAAQRRADAAKAKAAADADRTSGPSETGQ